MRLRVLVVDADAVRAEQRASELEKLGYDAIGVASSAAADLLLRHQSFDSVVCSEALREEIECAYAAHLPVVPAAGQSSAALAKTLSHLSRRSISPTVQRSLAAKLDEALSNATLALEPVVDLRTGVIHGRRARLVSRLGQDTATIAAGLGRVLELRRAQRRLACETVDRGDAARLMLDCTLDDLLDAQLYNQFSAWGLRARAFMLTASERDVVVLGEADARDRFRSLRATGFSIVARIGVDIAGPMSAGVMVPSHALLDVAELGGSGPATTRMLASAAAACRRLGVRVIAEVATPEQARCARDTGCTLAVGPGVAAIDA